MLKKDLFHRPGFCAGRWECSEVTVPVHKLSTTMPAIISEVMEPAKARQNKGLIAGSMMSARAGLSRVFF